MAACLQALHTEAGESWQSLSYVHSVMYIAIVDGGPGAEHKSGWPAFD